MLLVETLSIVIQVGWRFIRNHLVLVGHLIFAAESGAGGGAVSNLSVKTSWCAESQRIL